VFFFVRVPRLQHLVMCVSVIATGCSCTRLCWLSHATSRINILIYTIGRNIKTGGTPVEGTLRRQSLCLGTVVASGASYTLQDAQRHLLWPGHYMYHGNQILFKKNYPARCGNSTAVCTALRALGIPRPSLAITIQKLLT
jgi:hypothetical protein